ncbi:hypothetical protein ADK86_20215 [Streptomyces sp. NRRL F-5755]|uniref:hypothetical protein n=1 Tax=Streptomyces sp. NRRL F-5755 TaxID=1519475 RepID=UPI0006AE0DFD|nr:hypothetical protein [Streptomyces sp. NRRL F-5755]KOT92560.1 hypothetical protein ADK86_20215 [Streptomyces sp. NRRL F-5755]
MAVEFIGIDPHTDRDHCPTVWADADAQELLLQGWKPDAATQTACESTSPAHGPVPGTEAIVRVPARLIPMIREACDVIERARVC